MTTLGASLSKLYLKYQHSTLEHFTNIYKMPLNPKVVLYGAHNKLFSDVLKKNFGQGFKLFKSDNLLSEGNTTDDALVEQVAKSITEVDEQFNDGYILEDFPKTLDQAKKLDSLLDGINLAVYLNVSDKIASKLKDNYLECTKCGLVFNTQVHSTTPQQPGYYENCPTKTQCSIVKSDKNLRTSSDYESKVKPLLNYYEERGLLLNFTIDENWNFDEAVSRLSDAILANIKL